MRYISIEEAQRIHQLTIIHSDGGVFEHLNLGRLESVLVNIQNDDDYPTFVDKLTHLFFCTCKFHCFADGNKRLAMTLSAQLLLLNGYRSVAKHFLEKTENISYQVAAGKIDKELLHHILQVILKNRFDSDEVLKLETLNAIS